MKLTLSEKQLQVNRFMVDLNKKCNDDKSFKQNLINSPMETLMKCTKGTFSIPNNKKLVVIDQTEPNTIYLNIPTKPNLNNLELTDEQLEMVAGGEFVVGGTIAGLCVLGAGIGVGWYFL